MATVKPQTSRVRKYVVIFGILCLVIFGVLYQWTAFTSRTSSAENDFMDVAHRLNGRRNLSKEQRNRGMQKKEKLDTPHNSELWRGVNLHNMSMEQELKLEYNKAYDKRSNTSKKTNKGLTYVLYNYTETMEPVQPAQFTQLYMSWFEAYRKLHGQKGKNSIPPHWSACPFINTYEPPRVDQYCPQTDQFHMISNRNKQTYKYWASSSIVNQHIYQYRASKVSNTTLQTLKKLNIEADISELNAIMDKIRDANSQQTVYRTQPQGHILLSPLDCHYFPAVACIQSASTVVLLHDIRSNHTSLLGNHSFYTTTASPGLRRIFGAEKNSTWLLGLDEFNTLTSMNWGTQELHHGWMFQSGGHTFRHEWKWSDEPPGFLSYIHVFRSALVDFRGNVFTGEYKIPYHSCFQQKHLQQTVPQEEFETMSEVFVLSIGFARKNYYHTTIQMLARATLYREFLTSNPHIYLHVRHNESYQSELLAIMGIHNPLTSANVNVSMVYLPQGTGCAQHTIYTQHMALHFKRYVETHIVRSPYKPIILLVRRQRRGFGSNDDIIRNILTSYANLYNLDFREFSDDPLPGINTTMELFYKSKVIVAPHGAGLTNILFSQPGTFLLEVLLRPPSTYPCYMQLAHVLGMRYHAMLNDGKICLPEQKCFVGINVKYVNSTLNYALHTLFGAET